MERSTTYELEVQKPSMTTGHDVAETNVVQRGPTQEQEQEQHSVRQSSASQVQDEKVMARFGKRQQLKVCLDSINAILSRDPSIRENYVYKANNTYKRRFNSLSSVGLLCGIMLTWVSVLSSLQYGLANGGTAGVIYGYIVAWIGGFIQALVMAEMASMIPLSGGPFNWVAILAPEWCRKYLSYTAGWMTILAYQAFASAVCYTNAAMIQGLVILNYPDYSPKLWHATLLFYAVIGWAVFVNTYLGRLLPRMESILLILYVLCFFWVMIPLAYLADHRSASEVFGEFQNFGGWDSMTLSFFVGWFTSITSFLGSDASDHIAEEIYDAPRVIPFSIWFAFLFNGVMGFAMIITVLFCIQDVEAVVNSETGFPIMEIFVNALDSHKAGSAMSIMIVVVNVLSTSSSVAAASRTLWAFSRENGLPGSKFIVKVDPKTRLPYNAIIVTLIINSLLNLISIGSLTIYDALYSVVLAAYYSAFLIAASVMLYKRLTVPISSLPWGPFRLGRFGVPLTIFSILYAILGIFFSFWPSYKDVTPATMNYNIVIFGAAVIFSGVYWMVRGRKIYKGPIWEFDDQGSVRVGSVGVSSFRFR